MVNREVIEQWAIALESGEYPQTRGALRRVRPYGDHPAGFCCLGVLTDLAVKGGVTEAARENEDGTVSYRNSWDENDPGLEMSQLPRIVQVWAGLPMANPIVSYLRTPEEVQEEFEEAVYESIDEVEVEAGTSLAELNDVYGQTFPEIAQIIRDNFLNG